MTIIKGYNKLIKKISNVNRWSKDINLLNDEQVKNWIDCNNEIIDYLKTWYKSIKKNINSISKNELRLKDR